MSYNIPNRYRRNNKQMTPAFLQGYTHHQYIALDELIDDSDFGDWVLGIFDLTSSTAISTSFGSITKDVISGSDYRFYLDFTIPDSIATGLYYFVVYNSSTDEIKYVSNCFELISSDVIQEYAFLQYRNSSDIFNYNYDTVTDYNSVFLPINLIEQQPEIEIKQYFEQSTGLVRNQKTTTAKIVKLETYFFDDEANNMMLALSIHDDIVINQKTYTVKTAYQIETNVRNSVQKGIIEMYDQGFSTINLQS